MDRKTNEEVELRPLLARPSSRVGFLHNSINKAMIKVLLLITIWYVLSTGLSMFNKKVVGKKHGIFGNGHGFPAPLLLSSVQFALQTVLAKLVFRIGVCERTQVRQMSWKEYLRTVFPNGVITGLDIGFSNKSLVFITMSFYTMCKSTTPLFLLLFAFVWGIEKPSWSLAGVVLIIASGLLLLVAGETEFDGAGFALVMLASCFSGLRFTLTQVLLHGHKEDVAMGGPLEVLEVLTPIMSVTVLVLSIIWERLWDVLPGSIYFSSINHSLITLAVIMAGAVIAFLMVWTEYMVIKETSALTFLIAGTFKEVVTVLAAVVIMGDHFGLMNGIGLVIVMVGILLFNWYKYSKIKIGELQQTSRSSPKFEKDDDGIVGAYDETATIVMLARRPSDQTPTPRKAETATTPRKGGETELQPLLGTNGLVIHR